MSYGEFTYGESEFGGGESGVVSKSLTISWDTTGFVSKTLGVVWHTRSTVAKSLGVVWDTTGFLSKTLGVRWNTEATAPTAYTYTDVPIPPEFLASLLGPSTQIFRRVDIYEVDGTTPWMIDAPTLDGNVSVDMTRDERRMFDLLFDNADSALANYPGGFWYDKVIKVWRGVELGIDVWQTQIGEFLIDSIKGQDFPHTIAVTGRDYTAKLMEAEFPAATTFDGSLEVDDVIKSIALNGGITKFNIPAMNQQLGRDFAFEAGTKRWDVIKQIATAFGYVPYFDARGYLVLELQQDPVTSPLIWTFATGEEGNLVAYRKSTNQTRIYNQVVVTGEAANQLPVYAVAENHEPSSPTSIENLGRVKSYRYTSSFLNTEAQCLDVATRFLWIHALESFDVDFESIVLPWLDVGGITGFVDPNPAPGDPDRFLLSSFTLPMGLGPMTGNARRVTVVG